MMCKEDEKALAAFYQAMEQSLSQRPAKTKAYASRVMQTRTSRNPLRSYVASMRSGEPQIRQLIRAAAQAI